MVISSPERADYPPKTQIINCNERSTHKYANKNSYNTIDKLLSNEQLQNMCIYLLIKVNITSKKVFGHCNKYEYYLLIIS